MILPAALLGTVSVLTLLAASVEGQLCQTCILVNTTCYNVSKITDLQANFRKHIVIPKMGVLWSNNTLFFSYEPVIEDEEYYKVGFLNLDDTNLKGSIEIFDGHVINLGTFDIDQKNGFVYFGGSDGIFVLDSKANTMQSYSSRGDTITNIFFKDLVYFSKYNDKGIIIKNGDEFTTLYKDILVMNFVVTKYNVLVFTNITGMHVRKGDMEHKISGIPYFRGITTDAEGTVYAWWLDGLYKVVINKDLKLSKIVRVAEMYDIGAMTFDKNNNILFTSDKSLYIMKRTAGCNIGETTL